MTKKIKIIAAMFAIGTFALNISIDSDGSLGLISGANAIAPETTTPSGWSLREFNCTRADGTIWGTGKGCMAGIQVSCDPLECQAVPTIPSR